MRVGQGEGWLPVAEIIASDHIPPAAAGDFVIRGFNHTGRCRFLFPQVIAVLELCLECKGLSGAAKRDAKSVLASLKTAQKKNIIFQQDMGR